VIFLAALAFAIAIFVHLISYSHGVVNQDLFALIGFLCLALAGWRGPEWPFRRGGA
jgi:hypothetical protein